MHANTLMHLPVPHTLTEPWPQKDEKSKTEKRFRGPKRVREKLGGRYIKDELPGLRDSPK